MKKKFNRLPRQVNYLRGSTRIEILLVVCGLWSVVAPGAHGQNVNVVNPTTRPANVNVVSGSITSAPATATTVVSTAKENKHVLKASAGSLKSVHGSSDTDQWILIMNSTTVAADGAVTLLYPPIHVTAGGNFSVNFTTPLVASTGICICNSNANSFTKTIGSADCIFTAQVQ